MSKYVQIEASRVPDKVHFTVPRNLQGQTIEVAFGGFGAGPWDDCDLYKRVHDRSVGPDAVRYYKLAG